VARVKVRHYEMNRGQRLFSIASIAMAAGLLAMVVVRVAATLHLSWWMAAAFLAGVAAADLASGLVHWGADTWGDDDLPVIGRRLLKPFRLHHVDPDEFLRRRFVDANGDIAFVTVPVLMGLLLVPLEPMAARVGVVFGLGVCGVGMWTNQMHQWAHMRVPPGPVRWLQDHGMLLGRTAHAAHHAGAYDRHYCITTGWWNRPLEAVGFFRRLERAITAATGARPREDDRRYEAS
jgi:ubiquitin-conjugating enzyme E2 variant